MISKANMLLGIPLEADSVDLVLTDPPYDFTWNVKLKLQEEFKRVCKGDIIVFSPPENQWKFPDLTRYLFWVKATSTKNFSRNYGRFVEMIFLYKRSEVWNTKYHWSNYTGVYEDKVMGLSSHPFEKPESLIERFILLHSNEGDTVLDPFSGSGTVVRVAEKLGRIGIGFDKDPRWAKS